MFSKSQYVKYKNCHKWLWLYKNKHDIMNVHDNNQKRQLEIGIKIGELARKKFANGVLVKESPIEIAKTVETTKKLLETENTIFEASFLFKEIFYNDEGKFVNAPYDCFARVDILNKTPDGWDLIEVKSSTEVKDEYLSDVSMQAYVLTGCKLKLNKVYIMHVNGDYVKQDSEIDLDNFFTLVDVTKEVEDYILVQRTLLEMDYQIKQPEPNATISKTMCGDCEFHSYCWKDIPSISVYNLPRIKPDKINLITKDGYLDIKDIPANYLTSEIHLKWLEVYKSGRPYIDRQAIADLLSELKYPLYFLDFETTQQAIPIWENSSPYQQIPFQASLHILESENAELKHFEYLFENEKDPRGEMINFLLKYIGDTGTIIAHNIGFEKGVIKNLSELNISNEDKLKLESMTKRFWDTMTPFQKYYLHPNFNCSASLKKVLPVMVPSMTYEGMDVANGGDAMEAFDILYNKTLPPDELSKKRTSLLEYCKQDTLAMVYLVKELQKILTELK